MNKTTESRTGAMACLNALRIVESVSHCRLDSDNEDTDTYWRDKDNGVVAMLNAAGVQSGFLAGFISTFAEYVHMIEAGGGIPNLYVWKPEAAMTDEEKTKNRAYYEEDATV
jgi:hypothetical protein